MNRTFWSAARWVVFATSNGASLTTAVAQENTEPEVEDYLRRRFERTITKMTRIKKEDLDLVRLVPR